MFLFPGMPGIRLSLGMTSQMTVICWEYLLLFFSASLTICGKLSSPNCSWIWTGVILNFLQKVLTRPPGPVSRQ